MVTGRKDREDSSAFADGTEYMKKNLGIGDVSERPDL